MEIYFLAVLFIVMILALGSGFPVAFALPGAAILSIGLAAFTGWLFFADTEIFFAQDGPIEWLTAGVTNFRGIYWEVERDTLIAIPLFIFMGIMLQRSKIAEDLLVTMAQLFGRVPGGLGISVVVVGALLAATTGIVGATVVAMGLISLPAMMRNKYSPSLATGTICASGTLGQIIPPSIVLIILADQLSSAADQASQVRKSLYKEATGEFSMPSSLDVISTSAGDMFLGAFLPGLVLVGMYLVFILALALLRPSMAPPVQNNDGFGQSFLNKVVMSLFPPLLLIFVVLGSIIMGIATVNQAGAIGAVGATIMAGYRLYEGKGTYIPAILALVSVAVIIFLQQNFDLNIRMMAENGTEGPIALAGLASFMFITATFWSGYRTLKIDNTLREVMIETAKTTSLVFIILLGAAMLTAAFRGFGGEHFVKEFLTTLPGGFWTQFIVVMAVIFIMGFFLDFIEIAVVVVPIVAPILLADPSANVTAVWLGVMIGVNIQTSFLTPPFGFALFYLRGVADKAINTLSIYKGVVPFILLQLGALGIVGTFPELVNYLPNKSFLGSFNAPPPKNPKLAACVDDYLTKALAEGEANITAAIANLGQINKDKLPSAQQKALSQAFEKAQAVYSLRAAAEQEQAKFDDMAVDYAPLHERVRMIERDIRREDQAMKELAQKIRFAELDGKKDKAAQYQVSMRKHEVEKQRLQALIPEQWAGEFKIFRTQVKELTKAQRDSARAMEGAYEPVQEMIALIEAGPTLQPIKQPLMELIGKAQTASLTTLTEPAQALEASLRDIYGSSPVSKHITKARRLFKRGKENSRAKAIGHLEDGLAALASEIAWRAEAKDNIYAALLTYAEATRLNIGLLSQPKVPLEIVDDLATCKASHQNISLFF